MTKKLACLKDGEADLLPSCSLDFSILLSGLESLMVGISCWTLIKVELSINPPSYTWG